MAKLKSVATEQIKSTAITATVGDLVGAGMPLPYSDRPAPLQLLASQPMAPKFSYKLSKIIKAVNAELETYDAERKKLCEQHGKLNEETQSYEFEDKGVAFQTAHRELIAVEVTIPGERIKIEDLGAIQISAGDVLALSWLLDGE